MKQLIFILSLLLCLPATAQTWAEIGNLAANSSILSLCADGSGNIYAAGAFTNASGKYYVARWNGSAWTELGSGANALNADSYIQAIDCDAAGNVYAAGNFVNSSGKPYVAKWNGSAWSELGALTPNGNIYALLADAAGNVYIKGVFSNGSGKRYIAKWDGSNWAELGAGGNELPFSVHIYAFAQDPQGNLYTPAESTVSGISQIHKWNGSTWSIADGLNANNIIYSMASDPAGNIYAAGEFTDAQGIWYVAKWNGTDWSPLGTGATALNAGFQSSTILAITTDAAGNVYAAGIFKNSTLHAYVAKWDGSKWSEVGSGSTALNAGNNINTILADAPGNLYAAGDFTNTGGKQYVAKWNGTSTAVQEVQPLGLKVSPNPAADVIQVKWENAVPASAKLRLWDMQGRECYAAICSGTETQVPVTGLPEGIYLLQIQTDDSQTTQKIWVRH